MGHYQKLWLEFKALRVTILTSNLSLNDPHTSGLNQTKNQPGSSGLWKFLPCNSKTQVRTLSIISKQICERLINLKALISVEL